MSRASRRVGALGAGAVLLLGAAGAADFPPPVAPSLQPVIEDGATTAERWRHLTENEAFGSSFFSAEPQGDVEAAATVFVIPQYHRSDTLPLWWTSLGAAVARVQAHIDELVTVLLHTQRLSCVGTEGSAFARVDRPWELERVQWQLRDLRAAAADAVATLRKEDVDIAREVETLVDVVARALVEHRALLDGVGQAQLRAPDRLFRFGLEDAETNLAAVKLAHEIERLDQQLAPLEVQGGRPARDALTALWLDELPALEQALLVPLAQSRAALEAVRDAQRRAGADHPARVLTRLLSLVQRIDERAIQSAAIAAVSASFRARTAEAVPGEDPAVTPADKKRRAALTEQRAVLVERREALTRKAREQIAAQKVLDALPRHDQVCAAVMGANHEPGLVEALLAEAKRRGVRLGVIVVRPFSPDD